MEKIAQLRLFASTEAGTRAVYCSTQVTKADGTQLSIRFLQKNGPLGAVKMQRRM